MITLGISISGMHCDHCVRTVDEALARLAGVSECVVQIGKAEVVVDDAVTGKRNLFAAGAEPQALACAASARAEALGSGAL